MLRTFDLILIAAMLVAATITYSIKYDAGKQIAVISKLKRNIDSERDTITLLRADWSLMTQPGRLQSLVTIYDKELNLLSIDPMQITSIDDIPERPIDDIQKLISGSDDLLASGVLTTDAMKTGSIKPSAARR